MWAGEQNGLKTKQLFLRRRTGAIKESKWNFVMSKHQAQRKKNVKVSLKKWLLEKKRKKKWTKSKEKQTWSYTGSRKATKNILMKGKTRTNNSLMLFAMKSWESGLSKLEILSDLGRKIIKMMNRKHQDWKSYWKTKFTATKPSRTVTLGEAENSYKNISIRPDYNKDEQEKIRALETEGKKKT